MRNNNFDIVRLTLALMVVLFHSAAVSQSPALAPLGTFFSGELAVQGFFVISGFLIFASWERSWSLRDYVIKRSTRILPAYWLSTVLCLAIAFILGKFQVLGFLLANLTFLNFLHPAIPGVFEKNPYTPILNGALWTIKVEVMFYVAVPLIVWCCRRLQRDAVLWALFAASVALRTFGPSHSKWQVELPGQLCFFLAGALLHYHSDWFMKHGRQVMLASALLMGVYYATTYFGLTSFFFLRPLWVAGLTLSTALILPVFRWGPSRWGDFSYGTYVLHWPILQIITASGLFAYNAWLGLAVSLVFLAFAATFSWFVVEKPALDRAHQHAKRLKARIPAIIST